MTQTDQRGTTKKSKSFIFVAATVLSSFFIALWQEFLGQTLGALLGDLLWVGSLLLFSGSLILLLAHAQRDSPHEGLRLVLKRCLTRPSPDTSSPCWPGSPRPLSSPPGSGRYCGPRARSPPRSSSPPRQTVKRCCEPPPTNTRSCAVTKTADADRQTWWSTRRERQKSSRRLCRTTGSFPPPRNPDPDQQGLVISSTAL